MTLGIALAQPSKKPFEPQVGQPGKDVIWVPTPQALVEKMLDLTKISSNDIHYDLGSGDGRTVIAAAKRGARAFGVEYNPDMVALSQANAEKEKVSDRATFIHGDIFKTDFSKANVITLYLLTSLNAKLRPIILEMRPGTRVASNSFDMGDWRPDTTVNGFDGCQYCTAHYWMVPARVGRHLEAAERRVAVPAALPGGQRNGRDRRQGSADHRRQADRRRDRLHRRRHQVHRQGRRQQHGRHRRRRRLQGDARLVWNRPAPMNT